MQRFAEVLQVPYSEIFSGIAAEQALVGLAGIGQLQRGASSFRRNQQGESYFKLHLDKQAANKWTDYYNRTFPGLVHSAVA